VRTGKERCEKGSASKFNRARSRLACEGICLGEPNPEHGNLHTAKLGPISQLAKKTSQQTRKATLWEFGISKRRKRQGRVNRGFKGRKRRRRPIRASLLVTAVHANKGRSSCHTRRARLGVDRKTEPR